MDYFSSENMENIKFRNMMIISSIFNQLIKKIEIYFIKNLIYYHYHFSFLAWPTTLHNKIKNKK